MYTVDGEEVDNYDPGYAQRRWEQENPGDVATIDYTDYGKLPIARFTHQSYFLLDLEVVALALMLLLSHSSYGSSFTNKIHFQ